MFKAERNEETASYIVANQTTKYYPTLELMFNQLNPARALTISSCGVKIAMNCEQAVLLAEELGRFIDLYGWKMVR